MRGFSVILCAVLLFSISCSDDEISPQERVELDGETIDAYLEENGIVAITDESGLRYVIHEQGNGAVPTLANSVTINYEGRFLESGEVFDAGERVTFPLANLIVGWQLGLTLLNVGGSMTLYIPSGFAYGEDGRGSIPPNSILIFDIDLLDVR